MTAMLVGIGVLVLAPAATIAGALRVNRSLHFVEVASGTITVSAGFRRNVTVPASEVELHLRRHSIRPWRWDVSASKRKLRPLLLLGGFYFDSEKAELLCKEVRSAGGTVETS